jgi:hypothetical protein
MYRGGDTVDPRVAAERMEGEVSPAGTYNIICDQGKTLKRRMVYGTKQAGVFTPTDNTGFEARMQVRKTIPSSTVVLDLSTQTGEITLGGVDGSIEIEVSAEVMEDLQGTYRYDLELVDTSGVDDIVYGVVRGDFKVRPEVTR